MSLKKKQKPSSNKKKKIDYLGKDYSESVNMAVQEQIKNLPF